MPVPAHGYITYIDPHPMLLSILCQRVLHRRIYCRSEHLRGLWRGGGDCASGHLRGPGRGRLGILSVENELRWFRDLSIGESDGGFFQNPSGAQKRRRTEQEVVRDL